MSILAILLGLVILGLLVINPVHKLAKRKDESPRYWDLIVLLIWGFVWVGERLIRIEYVANVSEPGISQWTFVVIALLICIVAYGIVWRILWLKPDKKSWEDKLNKIGSNSTADRE